MVLICFQTVYKALGCNYIINRSTFNILDILYHKLFHENCLNFVEEPIVDLNRYLHRMILDIFLGEGGGLLWIRSPRDGRRLIFTESSFSHAKLKGWYGQCAVEICG